MINLYRKIRFRMIKGNKFSKYIIYAIGEIVLVVIGILIALQINNWNQNRIENEALWGYLNNIQSNIKNDLKQASNLNFVLNQLAINTNTIWTLRSKSDFTIDDLRLTEDHLNTLFNLEPFSPNIYGIETLKSTGYIGKLQGTDMEVLLFSYYDLVENINRRTERDKEFIDDILKEQQKTNWGISDETYYNFFKDNTIFNDIKDSYLKKLNSRIFDSAISRRSYNDFVTDIIELNFLGKSIISLIEENKLQATPQIMRSLELYNSDFSDIGQEEVVINGIIPKSVGVFTNSNLGFDQLKYEGNENYIEFYIKPNLEWAAAMFVVDSLGQNVRASKDFSEYTSIELELKGKYGGENLMLSLKDKFDPDDGTESRVDMELTEDWQLYQFDLRQDFPTADLKYLHQLAGFIAVQTRELNFYVRNIRFLKE